MAIVETAKELVSLVQKIDNLDLMRQVLKLQAEIQDLRDEVVALREQARDYKEQLKVRAEIRPAYPFYFRDGDPVPLCRFCWETSNLAVHLDPPYDFGGGYEYDCPKCLKYERVARLLEGTAPRPVQREAPIVSVPRAGIDWRNW